MLIKVGKINSDKLIRNMKKKIEFLNRDLEKLEKNLEEEKRI